MKNIDLPSRRILVVDDEEDVCMLLRRFFQRSGHEVTCAYNLKDAFVQLDAWKPDILILDNNLPDGTGLNALPSLCAAFSETRIYLLSAMELRDSALRNGATDFLEKPVDLRRLENVLGLKGNGQIAP